MVDSETVGGAVNRFQDGDLVEVRTGKLQIRLVVVDADAGKMVLLSGDPHFPPYLSYFRTARRIDPRKITDYSQVPDNEAIRIVMGRPLMIIHFDHPNEGWTTDEVQGIVVNGEQIG
jgi:hypothetical protein